MLQTITENIFVVSSLKPSIIGKVLVENFGNIFVQIVKVKSLQLILLRMQFLSIISWALWTWTLNKYLMV